MGIMQWFSEQMYILFSIYYYEVFLYKNNIQIGRLIQAVSFSPTFIVDFKRKLAWPIIKNIGFIKGHKIILHYYLEGGLPLTETIEIKTTEVNDILIKTKKVTKLTAVVTKEQKEKGKPIKLTEMNLPAHMLFEFYNAHFVTKTLAPPKSTDWTMVIFMMLFVILIIALVLIFVFGIFK